MRIRIIAILSANRYLLPADALQARRLPQKYRPDAFREQADLSLHQDSSLLSLLAERRDSSDTVYSVEATVETSEFIKGLVRYGLEDEWIVYELQEKQKSGIAFSELFRSDNWKIYKQHILSSDTICRIYRRKEV